MGTTEAGTELETVNLRPHCMGDDTNDSND
jgi:hypothetical protein